MNKNNFKNIKYENEKIIKIQTIDGKWKDANILFTFEENGDQFIMYEIDDIAYGAKVKDDNSLSPIEKDEWDLVEKIFNDWLDEEDK